MCPSVAGFPFELAGVNCANTGVSSVLFSLKTMPDSRLGLMNCYIANFLRECSLYKKKLWNKLLLVVRIFLQTSGSCRLDVGFYFSLPKVQMCMADGLLS